jgi:adenylylsulfate kinase
MTTQSDSGFAIWFTGLPASGKTTLAQALQEQLAQDGIRTQILDSDELRRRLTPEPTYSDKERDWFYDMLLFLAELLTQNGVNVLIAATASARRYRDAARQRLPRYAEVLVESPVDVLRQRDPKGLWQKADQGQIDTLPGAGAPYEPPLNPEARINTAQFSVEESIRLVRGQLEEKGIF